MESLVINSDQTNKHWHQRYYVECMCKNTHLLAFDIVTDDDPDWNVIEVTIVSNKQVSLKEKLVAVWKYLRGTAGLHYDTISINSRNLEQFKRVVTEFERVNKPK